MNEIVKQHNNLVDLPLRKFTASEIDILNSICHEVQNKGSNEVTIPFSVLRKLSDYKAKDNDRFFHDIESMGDKLMSLNIKIGTAREYTKFIFFPTFTVSEKNQTLTVGVHEKFKYILNDLVGNYTILELQECSSLHSSYAKSMYRKLCKFRDTGVWRVNINDFREYMCIPKSYKTGNYGSQIIKPAIKELEPYFQGLKYTPYYRKKTSGRGRPTVAGYEFTFKMQKKEEKKAPSEMTQQEIADILGWKKTGRLCPECKRPAYQSMQENENGSYMQFGHPDYKTGPCNFVTTNFDDLLDPADLEPDPKDLTEEQKENKKKLSGLLSGLFR